MTVDEFSKAKVKLFAEQVSKVGLQFLAKHIKK